MPPGNLCGGGDRLGCAPGEDGGAAFLHADAYLCDAYSNGLAVLRSAAVVLLALQEACDAHVARAPVNLALRHWREPVVAGVSLSATHDVDPGSRPDAVLSRKRGSAPGDALHPHARDARGAGSGDDWHV